MAICWGRNDEGQTDVPMSDDGEPLYFASLSAGERHTCGVQVVGMVWHGAAHGAAQRSVVQCSAV